MTVNTITAMGELVECTTKHGVTKDGANYINGTFTLETAPGNRLVFNIMASEKNQSAFESFQKFIRNAKVADPTNNIKGSVVRVSPGNKKQNSHIENNDYYDVRTDSTVSSVRMTAAYPTIINSDVKPEQFGATFEFGGYIQSIMDEMKDDAPTGRLNVSLVGIMYNGVANPVTFVVPQENAASFKNMANEGDSVWFNGDIINTFKENTTVTEAAWGPSVVNTSRQLVREFVARSGSAVLVDGAESYVDADTFHTAMAKRNEVLEQNKVRAQERAAKNDANKQAAGGYSGNANAFAAAVSNGVAATGRPQF